MLNQIYKPFLLTITLFAIFLAFPTSNTYAQFNPSCPSVYGASCPSGQLFINKQVRDAQTGELVESLSSSGSNFLPGQEVSFRIEVKNTGQSDLDDVKVLDAFPSILDFVSGPASFNSNTRKVEWTISKLKPGEFKLFEVKGKITTKKLSSGIVCAVNTASAQKDQQMAQDSSSFCAQQKVLGVVSQLPETGPMRGVELLWVGYLGLFIFSIWLFKKIKIFEGR